MIKLFAALAVLTMPAVPAVAFAADAAPPDGADPADLFSQLDTNGDGQVTTSEIPDDKRSLFERLVRIGDKDDDGKLDAAEFAAGLAPRRKRDDAPGSRTSERRNREDRPGAGRLFERLDANGDGKVELDEVPEQGRERFERLLARVDKDGDGAVTRREFARAAGGQPGGRDGKQFFKRLDKDGDGKLTADEIPEQRKEMFGRLLRRGDQDGDETLSLKEFTAVFGRRPGKPPAKTENNPKKKANVLARDRSTRGLFRAIDADRNGELDSAEIGAAAQAIRKLDKDGDGTVSAREISASAKPKKKPKDG